MCKDIAATLEITPIPDGILLHSDDNLRVKKGEWKMIITLEDERDEIQRILPQEFKAIRKHINAFNKEIKMKIRADYWLSELDRLEKLTVQTTSENSRIKRSPFDFVSSVAKELFGIATEREVSSIRRKILANNRAIKDVVHFERQMATMLNATHRDMEKNRETINAVINSTTELTRWTFTITKTLGEYVRELVTYNLLSEKVRQLSDQVGALHDMIAQHARRRADLERGKLTEELLPLRILKEVANLKVPAGLQFVQPLWWYFENIRIEPLWQNEPLAYVVYLPLVSPAEYLKYDITSFPLPVNQNMTVELHAKGTVGVNSYSGHTFLAEQCIGKFPTVCEPQPLRISGPPSCLEAVAIHEDPTHYCLASFKAFTTSLVTTLTHHPNAIVLVTQGEDIIERCPGEPGKQQKLGMGAYLIKWSGKCALNTLDFKIDGLIEKVTKRIVRHWVPIRPMYLKELANNFSVKLEKVPNLPKELGMAIKFNLRQPPSIPTISFESDIPDGVELAITVIGVVIMVVIVILCVLYRRKLICKMHNESDRGQKPKPRLFSSSTSSTNANSNTE